MPKVHWVSQFLHSSDCGCHITGHVSPEKHSSPSKLPPRTPASKSLSLLVRFVWKKKNLWKLCLTRQTWKKYSICRLSVFVVEALWRKYKLQWGAFAIVYCFWLEPEVNNPNFWWEVTLLEEGNKDLGTDSAAKWHLAHFCSQRCFHVHGSWAAGNGILLALDEIRIQAPSLRTTFLLPIGWRIWDHVFQIQVSFGLVSNQKNLKSQT